jgi:hypothetical protein
VVVRLPSFLRSWFQPRLAHVERDARAELFPDWGLRSESEELSAAFDPFSLQLAPGLEHETAREALALVVGDLDEARAIAKPKLAWLTPAERVPYMLEVTRGIHELRHFHDQFGTTAGFSRVVRTLRDALAFHVLWEELRKLKSIKLPLAKWAGQPDAPSPLREYADKRRTFVEWFNLHDGLEFPTDQRPEKIERDEVIAVIRMRNLNAVIPYIPLNVADAIFGMTKDGRFGRVLEIGPMHQKMAPLGCSLLMEGAAYTVQRFVVASLFGKDAAEDLHSWMLRRSPQVGTYRYTAVDILLTRKLDKFYTRNQLALTDAALMPAPKQNKPEDHPGLRFVKLAQKAATGPPHYQDPNCDLASWVRSLTRKLNWPNPTIAARRATEEWEKIPHDPQDKFFWTRIFDAFVALHLDFLARRMSNPKLLADPAVWFRNLKELPVPPILLDHGQLSFVGDPEHVDAYRAWYMFEHFQKHVLFGTTMPCAGHRHPHKCAGDPFRLRRWTALDSCPYSQFLVSLGVPELKIVRLSA